MDEVDQLIQKVPGYDRLFGVLRSLSNEGILRTIICGFRHLRRLSEDLGNPVYNMFQFIPLGNLKDESAIDLIRAPLTSLGLMFERSVDSIIRSILGYTSTHPGTIQFFCHGVLRELNSTNERTIRRSNVDSVAASTELENYVLGGFRELSEHDKTVIRNNTIISDMPFSQILQNCSHLLSKEEVRSSVDNLLDYMILTRSSLHPQQYRYAQPMMPMLVKRKGLPTTDRSDI